MIQWSEERPPNPECSYDHVVADTPLGKLYIEWKGWKDSPAPTCVLVWGDMPIVIVGDDVADTKARVQAAWDEMAVKVAELGLISNEVLAVLVDDKQQRERRRRVDAAMTEWLKSDDQVAANG